MTDVFEEDTETDTSEETYLKTCLEDMMMRKSGRHLVWYLLNQFGVFRSSFEAESSHQSAFNEGYRNAGLTLMGLVLQHYPDYYNVMLTEHNTKETTSE